MKKLLLLLCVPLLFSCGDKEVKNEINELKENNNKYEYYPYQHKQIGGWIGEILNKETGELWRIWNFGEMNITKVVSEEDLE